MTQIHDRITVSDGVIAGPVRRSLNEARNSKGSIHDDATVSKLGIGFRGGTVAGSVHLNLLPPLMLEAFGQRWFETGSVSMNFLQPTVDREPVRGFVKQPPQGASDAQVECWIDQPERDFRTGEGTASVGSPSEPAHLRARGLNRYEAGALRILSGVEPGMKSEPREWRAEAEAQHRMLDRGAITEPLDWYRDASPWGGAIVCPQLTVQLLLRGASGLPARHGNARGTVGLYGAIEIRYVNGPLRVDVPYLVSGRIAAVGQSPKTEFAWMEGFADDVKTGERVAELLLQMRYVKTSSPLWQS